MTEFLQMHKKRIEEIGKELYDDVGTDIIENMFYSIEFRIKDEIGRDANISFMVEQHTSRMEVLMQDKRKRRY
jgi:hypothetical protein